MSNKHHGHFKALLASIAAGCCLCLPALSLATEAPTAAPVPLQPLLWKVELKDRTLRGVLERWSQAAGWRLVWDVPVDYPIEATATLQGGFADAATALIEGMQGAEVPLRATLYEGNKVLRVVAKGEQQ